MTIEQNQKASAERLVRDCGFSSCDEVRRTAARVEAERAVAKVGMHYRIDEFEVLPDGSMFVKKWALLNARMEEVAP